jgi:hypothetical protein
MSRFRVEKRRAEAELTLSTGATVRGWFFLAGSSATHTGPERIGDLLNTGDGFFPFQLSNGATVLYNRAHVASITLPTDAVEPALDPGYELATKRHVSILLTTGARLTGTVSIYLPSDHNRLSDYANAEETFRYVETPDRTYIVNASHIVDLVEIAE